MAINVDNIVDVTVELSNLTSIVSNFNLGCIIGNNGTMAAKGKRTYKYSAITYEEQMVADGFAITDPEYKAAIAYFSQSPAPSDLLIGLAMTVEVPPTEEGGTATQRAETPLEALQACRQENAEFYGFAFCYAVEEADALAVASAVEAFNTPTYYFHQTDDKTCLEASTENVMKKMQDMKLRRTCCNYSTQNMFTSALLGVFSGLNTMQANSAYTMAFKALVGITTEDVDNNGYNNLKSYNGNSYVKVGRTYNIYMFGLSASGFHTDEVFFLDAAKFLIQENTMAGIVSQRKVPQTEDGLALITSFIGQGCAALASMGVIASGIWNGKPVLELNTGDAVPGGYVIQAESMASQSQADREKRVTPPIYVCLKGAGAIESVVIGVYVNR